MDKSRRRMLSSLSAAVVLAGCGGGDDDTTPAPSPSPSPPPPATPPPPAALSCGATLVTNNHGHALTIPAADVDSTADKTYNIQGQSDHSHTIVLTPAQLAQIKVGTAVTVVSSEGASHTHSVTVNCA